MEIFKLFGSIMIDDKDAMKKIDDVDGKAKNTGSTLGSMIGTAAKWGAGIATAATAAGAGLFALASKVSDTASEINDMSARTGISATKLQELKFATGQVGVNFESITGAVGKLTRTMAGAEDGGAKAQAAFDKLGIATSDSTGHLRKMDDIFPEAIKKLAGMTNETDRNALAIDLFGKGAMELVPLLAAGGDGIDQMTKQAHDLGLIMSDEAIAAGDQFGDTLDQMKGVIGGLVAKIGVELMPTFQGMMDWVKGHMPEIQAGVKDAIEGAKNFFHGLGEAIGWVVDHANILIPVIGGLTGAIAAQAAIEGVVKLYKAWQEVTKVQTTLQWLLNAALKANPFGMIAIAVGLLVAAGILLYRNWDTVSKFLSDTWTWMKTTAIAIFNSIVDFFKEWGPLILAILTGPIGLLVLAITTHWNQIKQFTIDIWNSILNFFTVDVPAGFQKVVQFFAELPGKVFAFLKDLFLDKIPYAIGYAIGFMIQALTDGIPKVLKFFADLPGNIWTWLQETATKFAEWAGKLIQDAIKTGGDILKGIIDFFKRLPGEVRDWLVDTYNRLTNWGSDTAQAAGKAGKGILDSIIDFVKELPGNVWNWLVSTAGKLADFASDAWKAAKDIGQNIVDGIVDFVKDIPKKIEELLGNVVKGIITTATNIKNAISSVFKHGSEGIKAGQQAAGGSGGDVPGYAGGTNFAPGGWSWVGERGPELMNVPRGAKIVSNDKVDEALDRSDTAGDETIHVHVHLDGQKVSETQFKRTRARSRGMGVVIPT